MNHDDTTDVERVVLFAATLPSGVTRRAAACVDVKGGLVVVVEDVDEDLEKPFRELVYGLSVMVPASEKSKLLERLLEHRSPPTVMTGAEEDALILALIQARFAGRLSAASDFEEWLTANGVAFRRSGSMY